MTVRNPFVAPPLSAVGYSQASSVMPVVRSKSGASLIVTQLFMPLKDRAVPALPVVTQEAPVITPLLPLPDASLTVAPLPSLNPYAATNPPVSGGGRVPPTGVVMSV